jgi:hypothetical protein
MTIAIAVACSEGVVLVSDSMTLRTDGAGKLIGAALTPVGKRGLLSGFAYILAGAPLPDLYMPTPPLGVSFNEGARMLDAWFRSHQGPARSGPRGSDPARNNAIDERDDWSPKVSAELIVCRAPITKAAPQIVLFNNEGERSWDIKDGAVIIAGAPRFWARENGLTQTAPPTTLRDAEELAVAISTRYIAESYQGQTLREIIAGGEIPTVAYPLNIFTIFSQGITGLLMASPSVKEWTYQPAGTERLGFGIAVDGGA